MTSENIINIQMIILYVSAIPKYKQIIIFILNVSLLPVYVEEWKCIVDWWNSSAVVYCPSKEEEEEEEENNNPLVTH